jgi:hypothetical protein
VGRPEGIALLLRRARLPAPALACAGSIEAVAAQAVAGSNTITAPPATATLVVVPPNVAAQDR